MLKRQTATTTSPASGTIKTTLAVMFLDAFQSFQERCLLRLKIFSHSILNMNMINRRPYITHSYLLFSQMTPFPCNLHLLPAAKTQHTQTHQHMLTRLHMQMDMQGCAMPTLS